MRETTFNICEIFKAQGFLFSDDTVEGNPIEANSQELVEKAYLIMDTLVKLVD